MNRTLEERLQTLADLIAANRATNWSLGDELAELVREHGRAALGKAAEVCGCSRARLTQLIRVAVAFPPEHRYPDVPWSLARACVQAAKRLGQDPLQLYQYAIAEEMSARDVAQMGRERRRITLRRRCEECDSVTEVEADEGVRARVTCPVCAEDGREVVLGVLGRE